MLQQELLELYKRDIEKLINEFKQYPTDADLWKVSSGVSNSAGNLGLHLIGSLNHFIGATLGNSGYVRNREAEFAAKGQTREELIQGLTEVLKVVEHTFSNLSDEDLSKPFPYEFAGKQSTRFYLMLLSGHLSYHLGQVNYHRRILV